MSLSSSVWDRKFGGDTLNERSYIGAVSGFTVYGLALAAVLAYLTMGWHPGLMAIIFVGLAMPIIGIIIALKSDDWLMSLFGYTLMVLGVGAVTGPTVALYNTGVVMTALAATAGVTVVLSVVGVVYPRLLLSWGGYLFGALLALVFVRIGQTIMAGFGVSPRVWDYPFVDYFSAVLFSLYIVYDWNRAMNLPKNLDNAVDSAVAIFLDIINLFLNLLRILGRKSDD